MVEFLKLAKNPRVGLANAWKLQVDLLRRHRTVDLGPTPYYDALRLRPNANGDFEAFQNVFRYIGYGLTESLGPIRTVIDAGANIGLSSVYFSKRLNAPQIVAIEPEKENFELAVHNTRGCPNVRVLQAALWPKHEPVMITNRETSQSTQGFQIGTQGQTGTSSYAVRSVTVPEIMAQNGWSQVDLLKIDIEGGELELFSDPACAEWLPRVRILTTELHDNLRKGCSPAFYKAIAVLQDFEVRFAGENVVVINKALAS